MWDIVLFSLILAISVFAAFYSGFYFGFMKREGVPPENMPLVSDFTEGIKEITKKKEKEVEPKGFYD